MVVGRALIVLALLAHTARAETPAEAKAIMRDYFDGEKTGGYVLVGMGIAGVASGTFLLKADCEVRQGMSYPLLAAGALQLAAGVYIGVASDNRIADFGKEIDRDGQAWTLRERDRMDGVQTQFTVLKLVELGLVAGGAGLAYYGYRTRRLRLEGAGIGIAIEAAATLLFDIWASRRADDYRDKLGGVDIVTPRVRFAF
jgi:hypothetical protein